MSQERLRLLFCDHLNLARGKYLPAGKMEADGASRFAQALYGVHFDRDARRCAGIDEAFIAALDATPPKRPSGQPR